MKTSFFSYILRLCVYAFMVFSFNAHASKYGKQPLDLSPRNNPNELPKALEGVSVDDKLGAQVTLSELYFNNEEGERVALSSYFNKGRPVFLLMVYYNCPSLCNFILNGFVNQIKTLDWTIGQEFDVVAVSINPKEGPELAKKKKENYVRSYGRMEAKSGWHFLTGEESQIKELAHQVGFGYEYIPEEGEYAHGAVTYVLTSEGVISRNLYGIEFPTKDLRLSLLEASQGKIRSIVDKVILFCFKYNHEAKGYTLVVFRLMQLAGGLTVLIIGLWLSIFWIKQRRAR